MCLKTKLYVSQNIIPTYLNQPVTTKNATVFTSLLDKLTPMGIKKTLFESGRWRNNDAHLLVRLCFSYKRFILHTYAYRFNISEGIIAYNIRHWLTCK